MAESQGPAVVQNQAEGRFELLMGGEVAGIMAYEDVHGTLALTHTEIDQRFEGQGLGSALARGVLDTARERGVGVLPYCPFVRSYLERHPEYVDLVPRERRSRFGLPA